MNRGSIPGFYYDEEKKKYFKIQANHVAPKDSKYAKSNVSREQRETKRRKKEHAQQHVRNRQTVTQSPVLKHPATGGIGITREHGSQQHSEMLANRDAFTTSQFRSSYMWPGDCGFLRGLDARTTDLHFSNHTQSALMAFQHDGGRSFTYYGPRLPLASNSRVFPSDDWTSSQTTGPSSYHVEAFHSSIVSTSLSWSASHAAEGILICAQQPHHLGNVLLSYDHGGDSQGTTAAATIRVCLGLPTNSLWASEFRSDARLAAISGTDDIFVLDHEGNVAHRLPLASESRAIAWLNPNVIAYGQHTPFETSEDHESAFLHRRAKHKNHDVQRGLMLWDLRASDTALRFPCSAPLTGILAPRDTSSSSPNDSGGLHLLVSTNRQIHLFDTRVPTVPLLSFAHIHQGPQLQFTTNPAGHLVAALNRDNDVQTYSLRTGKRIATLPPPTDGSTVLMRNLRWYDNLDAAAGGDCGPMLVACQGPRVVRWGFDRG